MKFSKLVVLVSIAASIRAQVPNPTQSPVSTADTPLFRITVVSRTTKAINYNHRDGSTPVSFAGTSLMPKGVGEAKVDSKTGATKIDLNVDKMQPAQTLGGEFLTYVLWAITPEGRAENLGEVMLSGDHARLQGATELQSFGMIVTAEPYYAVTQPSDTVVLEAIVKDGATSGTISPIDAKFELLARGGYKMALPAADQALVKEKDDPPIDLKEARQAMAIAASIGAATYASDTMAKARVELQNAEDFWRSSKNTKRVQTLARNVTQLAEDARIISIRKQEEALEAEQQRAAEARLTEAKSTADRETRRRELAEVAQQQEATRVRMARADTERETQRRQFAEAQTAELAIARGEAEKARSEAVAAQQQTQVALSRAEAEVLQTKAAAEADTRRLQAEADAAKQGVTNADAKRQQAEADAQKARAESEQTRLAALSTKEVADAESRRLREELRTQFALILQTQETARGLIVNMSDVLFDSGKATLKPGAREKLAKISGIVLAHKGLKLELEGHTDSVGSDELNIKLSQQRAKAVSDFLTKEGVVSDSISVRGLGKDSPVASNATAAGRQQNRRVEMVVSGEILAGIQ
ncbi:MAG TPA: OmpA family protein [Pyrinomonadaceae bacterium]